MPKDATFPFSQSESGDVDIAEGEDFYKQHVLQLGLMVANETSGTGATANDAIELESDIQSRLLASPYIGSPVRVTVSNVEDEVVTAQIDVPEFDEFEIPLGEPDV